MALKSQATCWIVIAAFAAASWFVPTPRDGRRHAFTISIWAIAIAMTLTWAMTTGGRRIPDFSASLNGIGIGLLFLPFMFLIEPGMWSRKGLAFGVAITISFPPVIFLMEWCFFHTSAWLHPSVAFGFALLPAAIFDHACRAAVEI